MVLFPFPVEVGDWVINNYLKKYLKYINIMEKNMMEKNIDHVNYNDLYFFIADMQRDIKHNYILIKSLNTRINCLEEEIRYRDQLDLLGLSNISQSKSPNVVE